MSWADAVTTVTDFVRVQARERPDAAAFWFEGRETSFAELDSRSSQCAQALLAAGAQPSERVATLCKNTDAFPVLWFGAMKARACTVPVNTRLAPPEIAAIVRDSGASVLVFGQEFADVVDWCSSRPATLNSPGSMHGSVHSWRWTLGWRPT